ncbi:MAG: polymerase sigma factor, sigma-70 family [Bacteroidetes bacterium]|nr:polymerase sigma factor, sigma-70 family [Bacteroidota bacterium]
MEFEEIYRTFSPKIFRLCMGYVNDKDWAKDLTQETFIQVWQKLDTFRNEAAIGTWIFRIASNICLRQIERSSKMTNIVISSEVEKFPFQIEDKKEEHLTEQIEVLYKCIATLEETERLIISLVLEDLPQKEIAGITGISEGNLRVKIHRIKQTLTERFNDYAKL